MRILIKNGKQVHPEQEEIGDLYIDNGIISNSFPITQNDLIVDAEGCYILPGLIDPHVHMQLPTPAGPSSDSFYTGSRAGIYGGVCSIIDFVTPEPNESLVHALHHRMDEAKNCLCDYTFHISPIHCNESVFDELRQCINWGINSFKVYMAYKKSVGIDDQCLYRLMQEIAAIQGILCIHAETGDEIEDLRLKEFNSGNTSPLGHVLSRPDYTEANAVKTAIALARKSNCSIYFVHISTAAALRHIAKAQKEGLRIYAETCPQYLLLNDKKYEGEFEKSCAYVISPPLRKKSDNEALWNAIKDGVIQSIGTDHCPFRLEQKQIGENDFRKIPNGAGGTEHRLALLYTYGVLQERINMMQLVELLSGNPAKIFGLSGRKGSLLPGTDADIVVWDPDTSQTISTQNHHQNCDLNMYQGIKTRGSVKHLIQSGNPLISDYKLIDDKTQGNFLFRASGR